MTEDIFRCSICGRLCQNARTDEESRLEAREKFGDNIFEEEDMITMCDDCWNEQEYLLFNELKT